MHHLLIGLALLINSGNAFAHSPDVACDGTTFTITRTDGFQGDLFLWQFSGHLLEHFKGNKILTSMTRTKVGAESWNRIYSDAGHSSINTGPSFDNTTKTGTVLYNGTVAYLVRLSKDSNSDGYFLRAFLNTYPPDHQIAEYYFKKCTFGKKFSTSTTR